MRGVCKISGTLTLVRNALGRCPHSPGSTISFHASITFSRSVLRSGERLRRAHTRHHHDLRWDGGRNGCISSQVSVLGHHRTRTRCRYRRGSRPNPNLIHPRRVPARLSRTQHTRTRSVRQAGERVFLPAMRACRRRRFEPEQVPQDVDLDHAHNGPAFVAPKFHVAAVHGRDDAPATIAARGAVRNDWHPAGEFVTEFAVHELGIARSSPRGKATAAHFGAP